MNFLETTAPPKARGPIIKRLLIRCPSTAKLTPSGQTIREDLWIKAKIKTTKLNCPHCGESHNWSKIDVCLARETRALQNTGLETCVAHGLISLCSPRKQRILADRADS